MGSMVLELDSTLVVDSKVLDSTLGRSKDRGPSSSSLLKQML